MVGHGEGIERAHRAQPIPSVTQVCRVAGERSRVARDIGHGARFAAEFGHEPQDPVGLEIKPVLRLTERGVENVAEFAGRNLVHLLLHDRIVA